jgi:hypothetical protein
VKETTEDGTEIASPLPGAAGQHDKGIGGGIATERRKHRDVDGNAIAGASIAVFVNVHDSAQHFFRQRVEMTRLKASAQVARVVRMTANGGQDDGTDHE